MSDRIDFLAMARSLAAQNGHTAMLPVIEKELLHYEILQALDENRLMDCLVFQGGTCLRLCYASQRFSEDLDFVGGREFSAGGLASLRSAVKTSLSRHYDVSVEVDEPVAIGHEGDEGTVVEHWLVKVVTAPARPDLPQQRINIEVASIPAYTTVVRTLKVQYSGLPSSYADTLIRAESIEEICADKLKAFVTSSYPRYRDVWDLYWIARQPEFSTDGIAELLKHKIEDYHQESTFAKQLPGKLDELPDLIDSEEFIGQMTRFLPDEDLDKTLRRTSFRQSMSDEILALYRKATGQQLSREQ